MDTHFFLIVFSLILSSLFLSSATNSALRGGSYLSVENPNDLLVSPRGDFSAGFYPVGDNAYCFALWFSKPSCNNNCTVVWMANRNFPVNGKRSELLLLETGNLILADAGEATAWSTDTISRYPAELRLHDTGNLVLQNIEGDVLWQSFDSPTDTLLPLQPLTKYTELVSSRSHTNFSSGFYKLIFDDKNLLRLLYEGPEVSSVYWPYPCGEIEHERLATLVRDKKNKANGATPWIEEIIDPTLEGKYDQAKMEALISLALQCVEEDKDARPTMSRVVEMLLHLENDD
ncbi:hypothetical protein GH714_004957 [Hevea brasiliensis]|uniref:Bulb-type lectin domain-containing protein n=1 Tax=Hevea brasiliensis TaxID=3981 RepID=A0A6A6M939_HEVBR|nr:hypothetical protein GH714_004957 [Hevea brasiliensis]